MVAFRTDDADAKRHGRAVGRVRREAAAFGATLHLAVVQEPICRMLAMKVLCALRGRLGCPVRPRGIASAATGPNRHSLGGAGSRFHRQGY